MSSSRSGIQVISRGASLLRAISTAMPHGMNTSDAARAAGVPRPTAHRILSSFATEGFCDQDPMTGRWLLGPELFLLGSVASFRYDVTEVAREHVVELAQTTGESAFFSVMRGEESVCLLREDGAFPIRSFVLYEGRRFPLGVASAGLAMLAFMPRRQSDAFLESHDLVEEFGPAHAVPELRERIEDGRANGFVTNPGLIVEGSWGIAAAVFDSSGFPAWALSLTGIESRFGEERRPQLGKLLMRHAHELTQKLAGRSGSSHVE